MCDPRPSSAVAGRPPPRPAAGAIRPRVVRALSAAALCLLGLGVAALTPTEGAGQAGLAPPPPTSPRPGPQLATWPDEDAYLRSFILFRGETGARVLHGALGLLAAAGGPLPASPSTAGQRLQGSPRWVGDLGLAMVRANLPALEGSGAEDHDRTSLLLAPRLTVAAGLFEGFSPAPTMGGLGSLDLVAELRLLPLLAPDGMGDASLAWGLGARIGVLRESFTLPGVTLVAMHRRVGTTEYRGAETMVMVEAGESVAMREVVELSPSVTSLRAVVGKDLLAVGVSAGVQRDWIRGDASIQARRTGGQEAAAPVAVISTPVDRTTWFVGLNRTWVVTQATLELGWSPAAGGPAEPGTTGFPAYRGVEGAFSGALSFRITY